MNNLFIIYYHLAQELIEFMDLTFHLTSNKIVRQVKSEDIRGQLTVFYIVCNV